MRPFLTSIILVFIFSLASAQTEKTLVKTFNLEGNKTVAVNLNGQIDIQEWSENTLRVHINIALENTNVNMLKYLITQGRYNLVMNTTEQGAVISAPALEQDVIINKQGDKLKEIISYTVFVPKDVKVNIVKETPKDDTAQAGEK